MKKLSLQIILTILVVIFFVVVLKRLIDSPTGLSLRQVYSAEAEKAAAENAVKIQQQKDRALWMEWKERELSLRLKAERNFQKIKALPDTMRRLSAFWWSAVVSAVLFMLSSAILLSVAVYKMARSNSDAVAMMLILRKTPKEEWLAIRESLKLTGAQLRYNAQNPQAQILDAQEPLALETKPIIPTARECLNRGFMTQHDNRFLWGFEHGEPYYMELVDKGFKAAIIGTTNQGKTWKQVMLATQCFWKGYRGIIIDLHWNLERSSYQYMNPFTRQASIVWCIEREAVNYTLGYIEQELDANIAKKTTTPLLIMIDDALAIASNKEFSETFGHVLTRCVTEGPKAGVSIIVASHNWQADSLPKQCRTNFDWRCAFKCDASEANLLFQDRKHKVSQGVPALSPGECILLDNIGEAHTLQGPMWESETIQHMADTAIVTQAHKSVNYIKRVK